MPKRSRQAWKDKHDEYMETLISLTTARSQGDRDTKSQVDALLLQVYEHLAQAPEDLDFEARLYTRLYLDDYLSAEAEAA